MQQGEKVSLYQTQDMPVALLAWLEPRVRSGHLIRIGVALQNRSHQRLYLAFAKPSGVADDILAPFKIEVWRGSQLVPCRRRGVIVKRRAIRDEDLIPIDAGFLGGYAFSLWEIGYQLSQGQYRLVLWYDSTRMRGGLVQAKRLWRGRTSRLEIPIEII